MVSLVIVSCDKIGIILRYLNSIDEIRELELIVVDTGLDSKIKYEIESKFNAKIVKYPYDEFKWTKACNFGFQYTTKDFVTFSNDDLLFVESKKPFHILSEALRKQEKSGVVSPIIDNTILLSQMRGSIQNRLIFGSQALPFSNISTNKKNIARVGISPIGAFMMFKKEIFEKIGLYDERYFLCDEFDISVRLNVKGYQNLLCNDVFLHHVSAFTIKNWNEESNENYEFSKNLFLRIWGFDTSKIIQCLKFVKGNYPDKNGLYLSSKLGTELLYFKKPGDGVCICSEYCKDCDDNLCWLITKLNRTKCSECLGCDKPITFFPMTERKK